MLWSHFIAYTAFLFSLFQFVLSLTSSDVYGPSLPCLLGVTSRARVSESGFLVPTERHGLKAMSVVSMSLCARERERERKRECLCVRLCLFNALPPPKGLPGGQKHGHDLARTNGAVSHRSTPLPSRVGRHRHPRHGPTPWSPFSLTLSLSHLISTTLYQSHYSILTICFLSLLFFLKALEMRISHLRKGYLLTAL